MRRQSGSSAFYVYGDGSPRLHWSSHGPILGDQFCLPGKKNNKLRFSYSSQVVMWFLVNIFVDLALYLLVDNITKFFIVRRRSVQSSVLSPFSITIFPRLFRSEYRFNILIYECLFLGFLIGFLSINHHFPFILLGLLFVHIFGTIITENRIEKIKSDIQSSFRWSINIVRTLLRQLFNSILNRLWACLTPTKINAIPTEWRYNYHLKPTKDLRLERVRTSQSWSSSADQDRCLAPSGAKSIETRHFQSTWNDLFAQCASPEFSIIEQFLSTTATKSECEKLSERTDRERCWCF